MLRVVVLCSLLAACDRGKAGKAPVPSSGALDEALPCVLERVVEHARLSRAPWDTLSLAIDVASTPTDRSVAIRYLIALAEHTSSAKLESTHVPQPLMLARVAQSLVELGAHGEARKLAEQALALLDGLSTADRNWVLGVCALVFPVAGKEPPPAVLHEGDLVAKLYAVQGLARGNQKDRARSLLASLARPDNLPSKGVYLAAVAWLGDLEAARTLIATETRPDPVLRLWLAKALVESRHPDARQILDANLVEVDAAASQAATPDDILAIGTIWSELVQLRERLDRASARAARARLDDWLLSKPDARRELFGMNIVRAAIAGNFSESARLEKALAQPLASGPRIELALQRNDFAGALAALSEHQTARASIYEQTRPPSDLVFFDGFDTAEVTVWLILAAKPSVDGAIVERFRALACTPPGQRQGS